MGVCGSSGGFLEWFWWFLSLYGEEGEYVCLKIREWKPLLSASLNGSAYFVAVLKFR